MVIADAKGLFLWELGADQRPAKRIKGFYAPFLVHDLAFGAGGTLLFVAQGGSFNSAARDGWQEAQDGHAYVFDLDGHADAPASRPASGPG